MTPGTDVAAVEILMFLYSDTSTVWECVKKYSDGETQYQSSNHCSNYLNNLDNLFECLDSPYDLLNNCCVDFD